MEYATIDAIMAYLNLTPFRIKVDRIFNGLNFTLYEKNTYISNINLYYKQIHFIWYMFIRKTNK